MSRIWLALVWKRRLFWSLFELVIKTHTEEGKQQESIQKQLLLHVLQKYYMTKADHGYRYLIVYVCGQERAKRSRPLWQRYRSSQSLSAASQTHSWTSVHMQVRCLNTHNTFAANTD